MAMSKTRQVLVSMAAGLALILSACGSSNPIQDMVSEFNANVQSQIEKTPQVKDFVKDMKAAAEGTDTLVVEITLSDNPLIKQSGEAFVKPMGDGFGKSFLPAAQTEMKKRGIENGKVRVILKDSEGKEVYNEVHK
ncbi:MAG: hypothetical protein Q4D73_02660 [Actinomycetaceae bacterium]|nr:hypothetical protein [Actinomycetaceae bacterium]